MFPPQSVSFLALPVPSSFSVPFRSFSTIHCFKVASVSSCLVAGCLSQLLFQSSETFIDGDETSCGATELSRKPKPTFKQAMPSTKHHGSWHQDSWTMSSQASISICVGYVKECHPWRDQLQGFLLKLKCSAESSRNTAMYLHPKCCWCSADNTSLEIDIAVIWTSN